MVSVFFGWNKAAAANALWVEYSENSENHHLVVRMTVACIAAILMGRRKRLVEEVGGDVIAEVPRSETAQV